MKPKPTPPQPLLITRIARLLILAILYFIELSVKFTAGMATLATGGIKKMLRKKPH